MTFEPTVGRVAARAAEDRIKTASRLMLPEVLRAVGGPMLLVLILRGELSPAFIVPSAMAMAIGLTALPVARAVRRGGLLAWGTALVWNGIALADFVVGWGAVLALDPPLLRDLPYALMPWVFGPVYFALHAWCLGLLVSPNVREAFVTRETLGTSR